MKLNTYLSIAFTLTFIFLVKAQTYNPHMLLPNDSSIKKGVLPNGMTYYLHSTDVTDDVASYYIIQNVGSILENDDQQGLAHFLEHMAFNGTQHFEGKGILNTLEKEGIVFGKDINAYTSFDETVYNIDNIPTTPELINTGLQILHDWSNYLLLTDEEIDAERGVIKEEWRTRQNGRMRIFQQTLGTTFGNSKYANRMPIGLMDVVENFDYKALRDFYHDWYRTDLQAIAIIGDIDVDDMEKKIIEKFSSIPAVQNGPERYNITIDNNDNFQYVMAMDPEVSTASIRFDIRHDKMTSKNTVAYLQRDLLDNTIRSILSERFSEIALKPETPFIGAYAGVSSLSRMHDVFYLSVVPKEGKQQDAFKLAFEEINRAVKFGFTKAEINRAGIKILKNFENDILNKDDRSHRQIVRDIQANYLENEPIVDTEKKFELAKSIFQSLDQAAFLKRLQELYSDKNRTLVVTGVKDQNNLSEQQARDLIKNVENDKNLKPYEEEDMTLSLMSGVELSSGKITKSIKHPELGFTTFTLSNGVKVHYQFVDKDKNSVTLNGYSDGGTSLIADEDLPSASMMGNVVSMSGLGEFSANDLSKVLAGKTARLSIRLDDINESINGSSTTADTETLLQLLNLHFTKPRFDESAYNVFIQNLDNYLIRKSQDLGSKMNDSLTATLYGNNHPIKRIIDKKYVSEVDFEKIKSLYNSRYADASDFEFVIVGDISEETLKPLLEQYVASIPTSNIKENWKDNTVEWAAKNIDKDIYLPMENPKTSVRVAYKNDMPYSLKNDYLMDALGSILQLRYTESLREEEGGTYGASARGSLSREPRSIAYLSVNFDCNPDLAEKLIGLVHDEINQIKNGNIQQNDLDKVLANFLKERSESKSSNNYELAAIRTWMRYGYNRNTPENFEDIIKSITIKDVQNIATMLLNDHKSYEIVFKPKITE